jgi:hypothetical protein
LLESVDESPLLIGVDELDTGSRLVLLQFRHELKPSVDGAEDDAVLLRDSPP